MKLQRFTAPIILSLVFATGSLNAATIPAGTMLTVSTVSLISSQTVVGRSFEAKLAKNISVKGSVVLKAGTKSFGKITSSRANPRKSGPTRRGTLLNRGKWTQDPGKNQRHPASRASPDSATSPLRTYRRHNSGQSRHHAAVRAPATCHDLMLAS